MKKKRWSAFCMLLVFCASSLLSFTAQAAEVPDAGNRTVNESAVSGTEESPEAKTTNGTEITPETEKTTIPETTTSTVSGSDPEVMTAAAPETTSGSVSGSDPEPMAAADSNPDYYWTFDKDTYDTGSKTFRSVGTKDTAAAVNGEGISAESEGKIAGAVTFGEEAAKDSYVSIPHEAIDGDLTKDFTIAFWAYADVDKWNENGYTILSPAANETCWLGIDKNGKLISNKAFFHLNADNNVQFPQREWVHLSIVNKVSEGTGTVAIYLNGKQINGSEPATQDTAINASNTGVILGRHYNSKNNNTLPWFGKFDDLRVYKGIALTQEELNALPGMSIEADKDSPAQYYWTFDKDTIDNGKNGYRNTEDADNANHILGIVGDGISVENNGYQNEAVKFCPETDAESYVAIPKGIIDGDLTKNFTISFWAYADMEELAPSGYAMLAPDANQTYWLGLSSSGYLESKKGFFNLKSNTVKFPRNEWVHLAIVNEATAGKGCISIYMNGEVVNTPAPVEDGRTSAFNGEAGLRLGLDKPNNNPSAPWTGAFDSFRVYTEKALSKEEIKAITEEASTYLDISLESLSVSVGTLDYQKNVCQYDVILPWDTEEVTVSAKPAREDLMVKINKEQSTEKIIKPKEGETTVEISVSHTVLGFARTYTIVFHKPFQNVLLENLFDSENSFTFDQGKNDYAVYLKKDIPELTITAIPLNKNAEISIQGNVTTQKHILLSGNFTKVTVEVNNENNTNIYTITYVKPSWFSGVTGVRWKPPITGRDKVVGTTPCNGGYGDFDSIQLLDDMSDGHTMYSSIDLTPGKKLTKDGGMELSLDESKLFKEQQYKDIVDFFKKAQNNDVEFFLHSRVNDIDEYINDMSAVINLAKQEGTTDKIAGIMIGEHESGKADKTLEKGLKIIDGINAKTDNFLQDKAVTLHGNNFGANFTGIRDAVEKIDFFGEVSQKCKYFSFAWKYFDMRGAIYAEGDTSDIGVWESHMKDNLNIRELQQVLLENKEEYHEYANCIFVGDCMDGLESMLTDDKREHRVIMVQALKNVCEEFGFYGFIFEKPFENRDTIENLSARGFWKYQEESGELLVQNSLLWWIDWFNQVAVYDDISYPNVPLAKADFAESVPIGTAPATAGGKGTITVSTSLAELEYKEGINGTYKKLTREKLNEGFEPGTYYLRYAGELTAVEVIVEKYVAPEAMALRNEFMKYEAGFVAANIPVGADLLMEECAFILKNAEGKNTIDPDIKIEVIAVGNEGLLRLENGTIYLVSDPDAGGTGPYKLTNITAKFSKDGQEYVGNINMVIMGKLSAMLSDADKTELIACIAAAQNIKNTNYTQESWNTFLAALATAKAVADDSDADREQVSAAKAALEDAIARLEVNTGVNPGIQPEENSPEQSGQNQSTSGTGTSTDNRTVPKTQPESKSEQDPTPPAQNQTAKQGQAGTFIGDKTIPKIQPIQSSEQTPVSPAQDQTAQVEQADTYISDRAVPKAQPESEPVQNPILPADSLQTDNTAQKPTWLLLLSLSAVCILSAIVIAKKFGITPGEKQDRDDGQ